MANQVAPGPFRQLGLIGYPAAHSLSPAMHNEAFRAQSMNCSYALYSVQPAAIRMAVEGIRALGLLGANVTIPYKEAVLPYLDEIAPTAAQVGAVNTIVNRGGKLVGYNTDGWGFIASLEEAGVKPARLHAMVLGAGGAARAVALHLALAGVESLTISNRTLMRAEHAVQRVHEVTPSVPLTAVAAGTPDERTALMEAQLVVNCTVLGMAGRHPDESPVTEINLLRQDAVVYDAVYRPAVTRLIREARQRGLRTIGGLGMLVHQGACSWEYWFGRRGPVGTMYEAARVVLEGEDE